MKTITRDVREGDLDQVARLFDLYRQFYEQPPDIGLARSFLADRIAHGESVILVAENDKLEIVGFCQLYPSYCSVQAKPIFVLYDLFVQPSARLGGAGRLLLEAAEAKARSAGKARMDLTTAKSNLPAQALYESQGWIRDEVFFAYNKAVSAADPGLRCDFEQVLNLPPGAALTDGDTLAL